MTAAVGMRGDRVRASTRDPRGRPVGLKVYPHAILEFTQRHAIAALQHRDVETRGMFFYPRADARAVASQPRVMLAQRPRLLFCGHAAQVQLKRLSGHTTLFEIIRNLNRPVPLPV